MRATASPSGIAALAGTKPARRAMIFSTCETPSNINGSLAWTPQGNFSKQPLKAKAAIKTIDDTNIGKNHSPAGYLSEGMKRTKE